MSDATSTKSNTKSEIYLDGKNSHSRNIESNNFGFKKKIKIYAVYNPESHPNFYLHNKLNWYKNFD